MDLDKELEGGLDVASPWFKFEKVGDYIKGTLISRELKKGNGVFKDQWVYEIQKADGSKVNVAISVDKVGTVRRLQNCADGEIIAIVFDKELEPKQKGFHPTKCLVVKTWGMDPNYQSEYQNPFTDDTVIPE